MRDLWRIVGAYWHDDRRSRPAVVGLAVILVIDLGVTLATPLVSRDIVNALATSQSATFWRGLEVLVALTLTRLPLAFGQGAMVLTINEAVGVMIRRRTIGGVLAAGLEEAEQLPPGDIASRAVNDGSVVKGVVTAVALQPTIDLVGLGLLLAILSNVEWTLAILLGVSVPASLLLRLLTRKPLQVRIQELRSSTGMLTGLAVMWLSRSTELRALQIESAAAQSLDKASRQLGQRSVRAGRLSVAVACLNTLIVALPSVVVFSYGGTLVLDGAMSLGTLVAVFAYSGYFLGPTQRLLELWLTVIPAMVPSATRVVSLWQAEGRTSPPQEGGLPEVEALVARSVTFTRTSPLRPAWTLEVEAFEAHVGEVVGIAGGNGVGKTTLLFLLAGLYRARTGSIGLRRTDGRSTGPGEHRHLILLKSQDPSLFNGTLRQNLTRFEETPEEGRLSETIEQLGLQDTIRRGGGLDAHVEATKSKGVSVGELQWLAMARTVYSTRTIWLLDEPQEGLDTTRRQLLRQIIEEEKKHRAIVIVTHDPELLAVADRVYEVSGGTTGTSTLRFRPSVVEPLSARA